MLTSSKVPPGGFGWLVGWFALAQPINAPRALASGGHFMQLASRPPITVHLRTPPSKESCNRACFQPRLLRHCGTLHEMGSSKGGWSVEGAAEATSPTIRLADTQITWSTAKLDEASCYLILVDDDIVESYVRSGANCRPHRDILKGFGHGGRRATQ